MVFGVERPGRWLAILVYGRIERCSGIVTAGAWYLFIRAWIVSSSSAKPVSVLGTNPAGSFGGAYSRGGR
jgi:hypothetical protein